ncbi:MAG: sigma-70 family RNA polymerase sigma factor [Deltaproteobacteria bacterium]|nr:sigma-70 family RNA polymerase sigma factor [Deltaproteobacteria bacterium]
MAQHEDVDTRTTEDEDAPFVLRCRRGSVDAFEVLVGRHQKKMLNIAYRLTGDYDEACDVVQDAFLSAYRAIGNFKGQARFSTWLYSIVVNQARSRLKQRKDRCRHEEAILDDPLEAKEGTSAGGIRLQGNAPDERLEKKELDSRVQQCILSLEGEQREVIVLRDIQGFSYTEIGRMLKVPEGTIKSRLFRARKALKDCLKDLLGELL